MSWAITAAAGASLVGGMLAGGNRGASQMTQREVGPASEMENTAGTISMDSLNQLREMVAAGPGQKDITAGLDSQRGLAALLQQLMGTGGLPSQQDTDQANAYAGQAFAGQRNQLMDAFSDQRIQSSRNAARMGRSSLDPVLANKLMQEQTRQQRQLSADQGSFAAQFAHQLPSQRLNFAQQFAGVQGGLASQAMANRQTLLNMGQQIRTGEQNFRNGVGTTTQTSNDGNSSASNFMTGALNGAATGMQMYNGFSGMGGGSSSSKAPTQVLGSSSRNYGSIA